jgi:hypothetical protein
MARFRRLSFWKQQHVDEDDMEDWWIDTDKGKQKYWDKNLSQCHSVHHTSHVDWSGIEHGPSR